MQRRQWWVGGYGADMGGTATGISLASTCDDGSLELVATVADATSPAYLATDGSTLYAAAEGTGRVEIFSISDDRALAHTGGASSGGEAPCHLTVHDGVVFVSHYVDGSLGVIRGGPAQVIAAPGSNPHAHSTMMMDATTLASLDLGTDSVHLYAVESSAVTRTGTVRLPDGTGPRDIARHSSGLLYILGEVGGVLLVTRWDGDRLEVVASTRLAGLQDGDHAAAIAFHGQFVYAGLRGSNRISVLRTSADGLTVTPVGFVSSEGNWPRHLVTDGGVLHVANERSGDIASFRLGPDGMPTLISAPISVPSPTFLLAVP